MIFCPSYSAEEALPPDVDRAPDIMSIRSGSMIPLAGCVFVNGTIFKLAIVVPEENVDPKSLRQYGNKIFSQKILAPRLAHFAPFQKERKEVPSVVLPAAKTLLEFLLLTSTACIGPGISEPVPTDSHVELERLYWATLDTVLSGRVIEPAAKRISPFDCYSKI